jgi:hypothetical protein
MEDETELPDQLSRKVKATAAERGQTPKGIRHRDKLAHGHPAAHEPEWMQGFGRLKRLHKETVHVQSIIDQEFEIIEPEDRR